MRLSPASVLFGLLVLLLVVSTALTVNASRNALPELSVYSTAPNGGLAFRLWLEAQGYPVSELDEEPYRVDPSAAVLFVLQPSTGFAAAEADAVVEWVERGGRLVVAASGGEARRLLERFDLGLRFAGDRHADAVPLQPLLRRPPLGRAQVDTWFQIVAPEALAPWLGDDERVYLGSRPWGRGSVTLLTATFPLSNAGLGAAENASLALNLLAGLPTDARLVFDEYHHGIIRRSTAGWWSALLAHSWGWAALYALALGYLYLLLAGRRFGRPLVASAPPRRSLGEYVTSLAALYRRAGQRDFVADRLADGLKRELGTALGLSPRLADTAFAEAVASRRGAKAAALGPLLARLRDGGRLNESDLLALVRQADSLRDRLIRRSTVTQPGSARQGDVR